MSYITIFNFKPIDRCHTWNNARQIYVSPCRVWLIAASVWKLHQRSYCGCNGIKNSFTETFSQIQCKMKTKFILWKQLDISIVLPYGWFLLRNSALISIVPCHRKLFQQLTRIPKGWAFTPCWCICAGISSLNQFLTWMSTLTTCMTKHVPVGSL